MNLLALDVGSSSVKAAILHNGKVKGKIVRAKFDTAFVDVRAEVKAGDIMKAVAAAIKHLGPAARRVETIGLTTMSPSWVAMDKKGRAITPVITHQDRRSVSTAVELEKRIGKARHLKLSGNRPFPGGISSTTWAWHLVIAPDVMKRADLVGHLSTYLHRYLTHSRVVDPSHASFMGLYETPKLNGWNDELIEAIGASAHHLPQIEDADAVGGLLVREAGEELGLVHGTPVLVGCVDTSAAMLHVGAKPGQLMNTCGTTDVLALCTDKPRPHERLLTRGLGVGRMWVSVSTIAAAGSSIDWARRQIFADLTDAKFKALLAQLSKKPIKSSVRFAPYLAGERTSVEQKQGAFTGLTLATTREEMLTAIIEALADASAARLPLLEQVGTPFLPTVYVSGGVREGTANLMQRDWPGQGWRFVEIEEATLKGIAKLVPL